jgi:UDP-glucose 4-epimerase
MAEKETGDHKDFFKGKSVMITGGLGFIGSNLARRLVELEPARVIIVDALIKGHGGNPYNISGIEDRVEVPDLDIGGVDIRNQAKMVRLLPGVDCVFNLAGSTSHIDSKNRPLRDLEMNLESSVSFLESCKEYLARENGKPKLKVVFSATRDVYGKVREQDLPVSEDLIVRESADPQGIHKYAAEFHHLWYAKTFGFEAASLRLTNSYGCRQQVKDAEHGFLNWFIRQALDGEEIKLWGGGISLRDFNFVDDVVEAFLMTMASPKSNNQVYNLGCFMRRGGKYEDVTRSISSVGDAARKVVEIVGSGSCREIPYPEDKKGIEPGHVYMDATKIHRDIGWQPRVEFDEGIRKTVEFYRTHREHYW